MNLGLFRHYGHLEAVPMHFRTVLVQKFRLAPLRNFHLEERFAY